MPVVPKLLQGPRDIWDYRTFVDLWTRKSLLSKWYQKENVEIPKFRHKWELLIWYGIVLSLNCGLNWYRIVYWWHVETTIIHQDHVQGG